MSTLKKKCKLTPNINKICNEKTGRNVFITGKIGKKILSDRIKIKTPNTKSPKIPKASRNVSKTSYKGTVPHIMAGLLYLSYRHDNVCAVIPYTKKHLPTPTTSNDFTCTGIVYDNINNIIQHTPSFWNNFKRCYSDNSCRFIVFHLTIHLSDIFSHSNYMMYDKENKSLERFDPNGTAIVVNKKIDSKIKYLFNKKMGGPAFILKYYKPEFVYFQCIQHSENEFLEGDPSGFCGVWSVWYMDLRLTNPDFEPIELINKSIIKIRNNFTSFTSFIRNFSFFLHEITVLLENRKRISLKKIIKILTDKHIIII